MFVQKGPKRSVMPWLRSCSPSDVKGSRVILTDLSVITKLSLVCLWPPLLCSPSDVTAHTLCPRPWFALHCLLRSVSPASVAAQSRSRSRDSETSCPDNWQLPAPGSRQLFTRLTRDPRTHKWQSSYDARMTGCSLSCPSSKTSAISRMSWLLTQSLDAGWSPQELTTGLTIMFPHWPPSDDKDVFNTVIITSSTKFSLKREE